MSESLLFVSKEKEHNYNKKIQVIKTLITIQVSKHSIIQLTQQITTQVVRTSIIKVPIRVLTIIITSLIIHQILKIITKAILLTINLIHIMPKIIKMLTLTDLLKIDLKYYQDAIYFIKIVLSNLLLCIIYIVNMIIK